MSNLYVVESPLQALCAVEVAIGKKDQLNDIIVRTSSGESSKNDSQLLAIVGKFNWENITIISNRKTSIKYLTYLENRKFLTNIKNEYQGNITSLYIGEFTSAFMHMMRLATEAPNVFLLDDGAVTVTVIKEYINKGYNYPRDTFYPSSKLKRAAYNLMFKGYTDSELLNNKIKVITSFLKYEDESVESMSFKNVKNLYGNEKTIDKSIVYYFGSLYSEAHIISHNYEIKVLTEVKEFYKKIDKSVIYFAHRRESKEKLDLLENNLGFTIVRPDTTAELYLLQSKTLPFEIAGAFTSVLNNVRVIFPEIPLRSFKFKITEIRQKNREEIQQVYDYYQDIGITIET